MNCPRFSLKWAGARKVLPVLAVSLGLLAMCVPTFAQLNLGRIFGAVTDQTGGAVVGATISVVDIARGITRPLVTDGAGQYDASALIPGTYTVRAEAKGFKAAEHTDIEVGVGKEVRVDMTLQPGEQTTTVTVTGDLPLINTTNAELSNTLENVAVTELPMNGRNYQYLTWTRPGIVMGPTEGQQTFTSDGMNVDFIVFMFDGINDSNLLVGGPSNAGGAETAPAGGLDEQTIVPADAILEVNTGTSVFPAEYGEKPGAHVDVGFKSGTNAFHGAASAFGRDSALNAKNPFLSTPPGVAPLPKAPLTLEQFAGALGGPIKKDKIFFFADYEGQRYTAGVPQVHNEPNMVDIAGLNTCGASGAAGPCNNGDQYSIIDAIRQVAINADGLGGSAPNPLSLNLAGCSALTQSLTGNIITPSFNAAQIHQLATMPISGANSITSLCTPNPLLNVLGGNTNTPGNGIGPAQNITDFFTNGGSDNGVIKIDWHPSDKHSLNFEWYSGGGDTTSAASFAQQYWSSDFHTWANFGRAVWVWTPNASWLNEFRFGYDYGNFPDYSHECDHPGSGPNYAALGLVTGNPRQCSYESGGPGRDVFAGFPILSITGISPNTGGTVTLQDNFGTAYTIIDNISWTHGKHQFKWGAEIRPAFLNSAAMTDNQGTANFTATASSPNAFGTATALDNYIAGLASSGLILTGDPNRNTHLPNMGFYIQDTWRVTPRITLSYGLRYEFTFPWSNPDKNPSAPGTPAQPAHLWGNFNPSLGTATDLLQETNGHYVYNIYAYNFGPRIGIAWDVFGTGKTVVHSGLSVMQNAAPQGLEVLYSGGAELYAVPTGSLFYDANHKFGMNYLGVDGSAGVAAPVPANAIQTSILSFSTSNGVGSPAAVSALPWVAGVQGSANSVYPSAVNGFNPAFTCGDGGTYNLPTNVVINGLNTFKPPFCSPQVISPIYHMPYYLMYSLSLQHAFTNNWTMDIAYVGNNAIHLQGNINENTPTPGTNTAAAEQSRRPYNNLFPFYQNIMLRTGFGHANYNALQASVTHRLSHGLQITPAITWQHLLSFSAGEDPYRPQLSWGSSGSPIDVTLTGTYYIPSIKTPGQILEGWEINTTVYVLQGAPTTINDSADDLAGNGQADNWNIVGNPRSFKLGSVGHPIPCYGIKGSSFAAQGNCTTVTQLNNPVLLDGTNCNTPSSIKNATDAVACVQNMPAACINAAANAPTNPNVSGKNSTGPWALANLGCYVTGNVISPQGVLTPPAQGTFGNEGYGTMYGRGFRNWDFSVLKNWKFKERYGIQFRAEFFNVTNSLKIFGAGGTSANTPQSLGTITTTTDSSNPVLGNGPRKIQLGLKITF